MRSPPASKEAAMKSNPEPLSALEQTTKAKYLGLIQEIESLRLDISRLSRHKATLIETVKRMEAQAQTLRKDLLGAEE